jgi:hypothetical protein
MGIAMTETNPNLHTPTSSDEAQAITGALRKRLEAAVRHTATAHDLLNDVADLAKCAFDTEAWVTLGYPDWETYCQRELFKMAYVSGRPSSDRN